MATSKKTPAETKTAETAKSADTAKVTVLEEMAVRLDAMSKEAAAIGEDQVAKAIGNAAKSARWFDKQRQNRVKRVGSLVTTLKAKGLSDSEIIARLSGGKE